jgi:hypothetical protein
MVPGYFSPVNCGDLLVVGERGMDKCGVSASVDVLTCSSRGAPPKGILKKVFFSVAHVGISLSMKSLDKR